MGPLMVSAGEALTGEALPPLMETLGERAVRSGEDATLLLLLQSSGIIWGAWGVSSERPATRSLSCSDPRWCGEENAASRSCWAEDPSTDESPSGSLSSPSSRGATVEHQEGSGWPRRCSPPPLLEEGAADDSRVVRRERIPSCCCCCLARLPGLSPSSGLAEPLSREYLDTAEGCPPLQLLKGAAEAEAEG